MSVARLLLLMAVVVSVLHHATSATKHSKKDEGHELKKDEIESANFPEEINTGTRNPGNGKARRISPVERAKKIAILTQEGKPGWREIVKQQKIAKQKEMEQKRKLQGQKTHDFVLKDVHSAGIQHDSSAAPIATINSIKAKLSSFTSPLATKVKTEMSDLSNGWSSLSDDQRTAVSDTLGVVVSSLGSFGNAAEDPIGAVQGAIAIVGSISANFGPMGSLISMGLGFVSGILGLFGGGENAKSIDQVVREEIDAALDEFREEDLLDKAGGLVKAFRDSKSYLDGAALSGNPLSENEMLLAAIRVPMTQGSEFMGELSTVIENLYNRNAHSDAHKYIRYCELYAQLASLKGMILMQMISITSPTFENDINGQMAYLENVREGARLLFDPLFTVDFDNQIMPYFDPDFSPVTASYSKTILGINVPSLKGTFCIGASTRSRDLVRETYYRQLVQDDRPYITMTSRSNSNCYWKFAPHGNNIYSIVNRKGCNNNDRRCGWMMSLQASHGRGYANVDQANPMLWEITSRRGKKRIKSKYGCNSGNFMCNKILLIKMRDFFVGSTSSFAMVGQVVGANGYFWKLRRG